MVCVPPLIASPGPLRKIWFLKAGKSHSEVDLMTKVNDQITNTFESKLECDYKVMKLIVWCSSKCASTCASKGRVYK